MGRPNKTNSLIRKHTSQSEERTAIGTEIYLPNHSGVTRSVQDGVVKIALADLTDTGGITDPVKGDMLKHDAQGRWVILDRPTAAGTYNLTNNASGNINYSLSPVSTYSYKTWTDNQSTPNSCTAAGQVDEINFISTDGSITMEATEVGFESDTFDVEIDFTNANTWTGEQTFSAVQENTSGKITPVRISTTTTTSTEDDNFIIVATSGGNRTLNLHDVSGLGTTRSFTLFIIKNGAANSLIIDPYGAATIDGGATKTITTHLHCVRIMCYNGNWFTVTDNQ